MMRITGLNEVTVVLTLKEYFLIKSLLHKEINKLKKELEYEEGI